VHVAVAADRIAGVAVWLPPGGFPWSWRRKMRAAPALARVFAADPRHFPTFTRYGANAERTHPSDTYWYLVVLGVRPDGQRSGAGSRLMATMLERVDRARVACYLETSDPANVAFYERFGFVVTDPAVPLVPGGPSHVRMRRPPIGRPLDLRR
jgi:ribosomal protein S18 acetylase RimI-like enzyme